MAVEEILIKYKTDITDLQAKVALIESNLRKADKAFVESNKTINSNLSKTTSSLGGLSSAIAPLGGLIAGAFATQQIIAFGRESVKAFQEAELNAKKLQTAVSVSGGLQGDFDNLIKQSEELQRITIFSDDDVQRAQTAALQFGLTADEVEKLIPIVADFASATGQQLQPALDSVLRGLEGQARGLKLYGVNVDAAAGKAENLASITDQLTAKFEGQAEVIGNTGAGAIAKMNNELDDLKETIGEKLEPVLVGLTGTALVFVEAIIETGKAVAFLGNALASAVSPAFAAAKKAQGEAEKLIENIEKSRKHTAILIEEIQKSLSALSETQLQEKFARYGELLVEAQKQQKALTDSGERQSQQLNQDIVTYAATRRAIEGVIEARKKQAEADKLSTENLNKLTTAQLEALQAQLKTKTDNVSRDAVENIKKILEARKKAGEEELKQIEQFNKEREAAVKAANDRIAQLEIDGITDTFEKRRSEAQQQFDKDEQLATDQFNKKLLTAEQRDALILAAFKKFNDERAKIESEETTTETDEGLKKKLAQIDKETTAEITKRQRAFLEIGNFSKEARQALENEISTVELDGLKKRLEAVKKAGGDTTDLAAQIAAKEIEINDKKNDSLISSDEAAAKKREEIFQASLQAASELAGIFADLSNATANNRIENLQREQDAINEQFDAEQEAIEERVEKRIITEAQGENQSAELKKKRAESEKKANDQVNALKNKQAEISKQLAIFEATLNLAEAISIALSAAPPPFNSVLAAISAALAGAQLAAIIATPVPKFAFLGDPYVRRGNNPPGRDTIPYMLNEGERVVPTDKNLEHWDLLEAIDKGKVEQYVMKTYIAPIIQEQKRKKDEQTQEKFATTIAQNITIPGMGFYDHDKLRRKGVKLNNVKQLAKELGKEVSIEVVRALITERGR